jgi:hypothetical protein
MSESVPRLFRSRAPACAHACGSGERHLVFFLPCQGQRSFRSGALVRVGLDDRTVRRKGGRVERNCRDLGDRASVRGNFGTARKFNHLAPVEYVPPPVGRFTTADGSPIPAGTRVARAPRRSTAACQSRPSPTTAYCSAARTGRRCRWVGRRHRMVRASTSCSSRFRAVVRPPSSLLCFSS